MNAIAWCIRQKIKDQTDWAILMRICDHYNDSLGYAYPSQDRIADQILASTKTVQRHIKSLIELGYLQVVKSPNKVNKYVIPALKMDATTVSLPDLDATPVSPEHILDNNIISDNIISDNIIPLTNISSNIIVKGSENEILSSTQWLWKYHLKWFEKNAPSVKNHRTVLAKLINTASDNKTDYRDRACDELHKVFLHCQKDVKHNLVEYLNATSRNIAEKFKQKPKERVLSDLASATMEKNFQRIYKATKDVAGWGGLNYLEIREEYEKAFKEGSIVFSHTRQKATADQILEYFGVR